MSLLFGLMQLVTDHNDTWWNADLTWAVGGWGVLWVALRKSRGARSEDLRRERKVATAWTALALGSVLILPALRSGLSWGRPQFGRASGRVWRSSVRFGLRSIGDEPEWGFKCTLQGNSPSEHEQHTTHSFGRLAHGPSCCFLRAPIPVSWENDLHVPVLDDRIRWSDVIPDSLYEASTDGSIGHFVLRDTLDGWNWDEWVALPDTVIVERFDGEGELNNGLIVVEDLEVFGYSEDLGFELPGTEGMALTNASLLSGTMFLDVKHSLEGDVFLDYDLPGVTF